MLLSCATSDKEVTREKSLSKRSSSQDNPAEPQTKESTASTNQKEDTAKRETEQQEVKSGKSYELNAEEKAQTQKDLNQLVDEINKIISSRNYDKWLDFLTEDYIEYYSDLQRLEQLSESPILAKYGIKLRSLRDYFTYVVVASRKDVHIDDIKAIGEHSVKAYMVVEGEPVVVYTLEKVNDQWKITIPN